MSRLHISSSSRSRSTLHPSSQPSSQSSSTSSHRRALIATTFAITAMAASTIFLGNYKRYDPEPYHTSILTGADWVKELKNGHSERMRHNLSVNRHLFSKLCMELRREGGLKPRRHVGIEEMVATFLYQATTNLSVRRVAERFQRSLETVSRNFRDVLAALTSDRFRAKFIRLPNPDMVPPAIRDNPKFFPYFKDCLGAIDDSHIPVRPPSASRFPYRDRSGNLSQNILAACNWDMQFQFILTGWEGSVADGFLFEEAQRHGFDIPDGRYYVADAGFPNCKRLLVPYRAIRYHLQEWAQASIRPRNKEELFNLRHAQLRNVIERIFGVLKRQFKIVSEVCEYTLYTQSLLPLAIAALHNFIVVYNPSDTPARIPSASELLVPNPQGDTMPTAGISAQESAAALRRRDEIAEAMWRDYLSELDCRGISHSQSLPIM